MIYTISDVYGPRGGSLPLNPGDGYRAIYPAPEGLGQDQLTDLAGYLQMVVDPHRVRGVSLDGDKLEIIVEAASGGKITSTRSLYNTLKGAIEGYIAGAPAPVPPTDGGSTVPVSFDWKPVLILAGLVGGLMLLGRS